MTDPTISTTIASAIQSNKSEIALINTHIHSNPELAYLEFTAHSTLVHSLRRLGGFTITSPAYGLPTSFEAEYGSGGRLIIFNAEYDALPEIGHACGHNLIASASLAAFLGVAAALKQSGQPGRVRLLGTPAEEGGGGKLKLIEAGAYKGCDACLMVHPGPQSKLPPGINAVSYVRMLANVKYRVYFTGREAHASIAPWHGVNALDAVCLSYNAVSMLRQQIRPEERIHGIFREAGTRPNVTPADCCVEYYVRSTTRRGAEELGKRVLKCFEGAALATGCEWRKEDLPAYFDVRPSKPLCKAWMEAVQPAGSVAWEDPTDFFQGSTDMGNVCYECPGFHGVFGIETEDGAANHTKGFTKGAGTQDAFERALECGRAMAEVGWRVLADEEFAADVRREWEVDMKVAGGN
ncbi:hypothetical protein GE21DRAFT_6984 [Neurospora crassa]|uniref:Peptidase M20 domain-containing protein 2 n=2 Tax=Neurospora crassa TaxID=5141 RepID=Q1K6A4_NEUCR|nr:amidohydrolase [Neurospora crassa OR74A]EAA29588.1 amidohydrolase [Neurospora crassa OR74A]KHE81082.1 hypothetical protein GE21DRAFT_6984 [Neurospora crassa]CAD71238.1 related to amidohydrolase AmhX [Neurospora crassa]|eukprot:XP_958824.1 amidohydrolase [Neurospora crassa OR74A]